MGFRSLWVLEGWQIFFFAIEIKVVFIHLPFKTFSNGIRIKYMQMEIYLTSEPFRVSCLYNGWNIYNSEGNRSTSISTFTQPTIHMMYQLVYILLDDNIFYTTKLLESMCERVTCLNDGTCEHRNNDRGFRCQCQPGYNGIYCQSKCQSVFNIEMFSRDKFIRLSAWHVEERQR